MHHHFQIHQLLFKKMSHIHKLNLKLLLNKFINNIINY